MTISDFNYLKPVLNVSLAINLLLIIKDQIHYYSLEMN
jgi:hypothetical protein